MTRLKEVKGIVSTDGFFKRTRITVRVTSDIKGQSLSLADEKLRKRYPQGFEAERSLHRAEGDI